MAKRPIPEDRATELLVQHVDGADDDVIVVDMGEASHILKDGNFSDYLAYRTFCANGGTVTFDRQQLLRDAGMIPTDPVKETLTTEGRIDINGRGRNA